MAISKKLGFNLEEVEFAGIAKALAHPARVAIVKLLSKNGPTVVNKIVQELPLSQSTVSQHLKDLKDSGIIIGEVDGPRIFYSINIEQLNITKAFFDRFFDSVTSPSVPVKA